jgi:lipopolysaccharide export system permease protein
MKLNTIINRYLIKEIIPPFIINLVFFSFIFLMTKIPEITNLGVNYNINISAVFFMLVYSMPYFLVFIIPMSTMMTVLLTFLRLSGDNEILALKAGGVSIYNFLPPVLIFCLAGCLLTGFMSIYGLPWGRTSIKELTFKTAVSGIDTALRERTFNDGFKGVMLYFNKMDRKNKQMIDIFIQDQRDEDMVGVIVAPKGELLSDPDRLIFQLRLYNGVMNQTDRKNRSVHSINFNSYDMTLDLKRAISAYKNKAKHEKEMSLFELREYIKKNTKKDARYYSALIELHRKFSIPFACFALGILAVPLGLQVKTARPSAGIGFGLCLFLLYYLMLSLGLVFGETGLYPPFIGMWMPNLITGGIGIFLLIKTGKEQSIRVMSFFRHD